MAGAKKKLSKMHLQNISLLKKREELANLVGNYQDFDLSLTELEDMRNDS